jgi:hypothetical protein
MSIYNSTLSTKNQPAFKPTWLYIKQHNQTGLKYFGKTTRKDPSKYKGSGDYWKLHLKKHGNSVSTIWCQLFTDKETLIEYALKFSQDNNITKCKSWANLKPENGLDGNPPGVVLSESHKRNIGTSGKGKNSGRIAPNRNIPHTIHTRKKIGDAHRNIPKSEIAKHRMSIAKKGIPAHNKGVPALRCCRISDRKEISVNNFKQYDK